MAKPENHNPIIFPDCILLDNGTVVSWDKATPEMQQEWLENNRSSHSQNSNPDKGNGKRERRKKRQSRHHS